jgi:type II secretory pathway pseudopilin PulG
MKARTQRGGSLVEVLAAIIVVGIGIALFTKVQSRTSKDSGQNSKMLIAAKMIERHLEDTRIHIFKDTTNNWPPKTVTIASTSADSIKLTRTVSDALSPKDNAVVANVKKLEIKASWNRPRKDSLVVTTYVAKRF